jgi:hypothetical protein
MKAEHVVAILLLLFVTCLILSLAYEVIHIRFIHN